MSVCPPNFKKKFIFFGFPNLFKVWVGEFSLRLCYTEDASNVAGTETPRAFTVYHTRARKSSAICNNKQNTNGEGAFYDTLQDK